MSRAVLREVRCSRCSRCCAPCCQCPGSAPHRAVWRTRNSGRARHSVGLIDAPKMGKRLAKRDVQPDLILSSPAMRALTTAEIIAKKLDYKLEDIVVDDRLYAGEADDLLIVIHKLGDKLERVMIFGHNPELTELTHRLSSKIAHMPTCAVAEFTFVAKSWSNIGNAKPAKVALDYPKKS